MPKTLRHYLQVAKPGIVAGNLAATAAGFFLASRGRADASLLAWVLSGTGLVMAAGCVLNNRCDRMTDRQMMRTRDRVLARGDMTPRAAGIYAALLATAGTGILWTAVNPLCTAIVITGLVVYVVLYSRILKPRSVHSPLAGSLAGAAPPLAGYCAVNPRLDEGALILLAIFCLWQIPHAYAIAVYRMHDYAAAGIPTLPMRRGVPAARRYMVAYILTFTAAALMPTLCGYTGYGYLAAAGATGLIWLGLALQDIRRAPHRRWARRMFRFSVAAILILNLLMAVDATMPRPTAPLLSLVADGGHQQEGHIGQP